jgi:hypothetical protein
MQKVTFTNSKGKSIEIGLEKPFLLNSIEGLGDVDAEIQSQKAPYQDGSTHIASVLKERPIPIGVTIRASSPQELSQLRAEISSIFNPRGGVGILKYENENGNWEISVVSEHVPTFPTGKSNRGEKFQRVLIDLMAFNPYWLKKEQIEQLVVWEGGLEFPLELPTIFANLSPNKSKILINGGDDETPIFVTFNGPATAPITIKNITTGKYIEINQNLSAGEKLEIDTAFGQKRVTKVLAHGTRENAFHYIKIPESIFFGLEVGNNLIEYSTGADYEQAGVTISWRDRFLAV